jgi:hypothetical protein
LSSPIDSSSRGRRPGGHKNSVILTSNLVYRLSLTGHHLAAILSSESVIPTSSNDRSACSAHGRPSRHQRVSSTSYRSSRLFWVQGSDAPSRSPPFLFLPRYEDVTIYSSFQARMRIFEDYWPDSWALEVDLFSCFIIHVG